MTQEVPGGLRVTVDANGQGLTVVMPRVNGEGDYDHFSDGTQVRYYVEGGRLYRKQGVSASTVATRNVSAARFTMDGTQLDIELTCTQKIGARQGSTTLATEVTLRNEAMTVMFAVFLLGGAVLSLGMQSSLRSEHDALHTRALGLAEGGAEMALCCLRTKAPDGSTDGTWRARGW